MSATETAAPAAPTTTTPATEPATTPKRRSSKAAGKPAPKRARRSTKPKAPEGEPVTTTETAAPAAAAAPVAEQQPSDPAAQIRAAAFEEMTDTAVTVFAFDVPREAVASGVRTAREFWTLDGFSDDAVERMCAVVFEDQPTELSGIVEQRRTAAREVLTALEPIAFRAAAAARAARDDEPFHEPSEDVLTAVRRFAGVSADRARRGVYVMLALWQGAGIDATACETVARAWYGTVGPRQRQRTWHVVSRITTGV